MKVVIALGGNALGNTPSEQKQNAYITAKEIVKIIKKGHEVVLTHGNGPQVGLINLAFSEGRKANDKVCEMPFSECGAMSQGYIGYHLQNALVNCLKENNINKKVVSLITQVEVDPKDKAFSNPTKPIGSFYTKEEASKLPYTLVEDAGRGYRRVVPSPLPVRVIEKDSIENLINNGFIVITCGGGGIPVINNNDKLVGIDAVIDKDFASSRLAIDIDADILLILTAVSHAAINFNTDKQEDLNEVSLEDIINYNNEGHFKSGSMKPKVEACIKFLQGNKGKKAIITSIENASIALEEKGYATIIK